LLRGREPIILRWIVPRHVSREGSYLKTFTRGALEVCEFIPVPEHHFSYMVNGIALGVATDSAHEVKRIYFSSDGAGPVCLEVHLSVRAYLLFAVRLHKFLPKYATPVYPL
jgi:hypothetical protein